MRKAALEFSLLFCLLIGWYILWAGVMVARWGLIPEDAAARTLQAAQVFYGRDPKLSNLGFVWPPMPALLQLPLVLLPGLWPTGLCGAVVSALAGALAGALLNETARALGWDRARYLLVGAFALNPAVTSVSAGGLSEPLLMAAALGQVRCFLGWAEAEARADRRRAVGWLFGLGLAGALGVLTRYEGWLLAAVMGLMVVVLALRRGNAGAAEAAVLVYGAPPAYAAFVWAFFNWLVMKDPLYFWRGPYAALAYVLAEGTTANPIGRAGAVLVGVWQLSPLFLPALVSAIGLGLARGRLPVLLVAGYWLSLPAFLAFSRGLGQVLDVQYRYLTPLVPATLCLVTLTLARIPADWRLGAGLALLVLGPATGLLGMWADPAPLGNSLKPFAEALLSGRPVQAWAAERELAAYLRESGAGPVLTDPAGGVEMVVFFSGQPARFVLPADRDFEAILENPVGKASHVLVPSPTGVGSLHAINRAFSGFYESGAAWAVLEKEVGPYRLYRVLGPQPPEGRVSARAAGLPTPVWVKPAVLSLLGLGILGLAIVLGRRIGPILVWSRPE